MQPRSITFPSIYIVVACLFVGISMGLMIQGFGWFGLGQNLSVEMQNALLQGSLIADGCAAALALLQMLSVLSRSCR